jgi:hypothetical protein
VVVVVVVVVVDVDAVDDGVPLEEGKWCWKSLQH